MTLKERLFKRLPKKYHKYIEDIQEEWGLIDNCKYMVYFTEEGKALDDNYTCLPFTSFKEIYEYLKGYAG